MHHVYCVALVFTTHDESGMPQKSHVVSIQRNCLETLHNILAAWEWLSYQEVVLPSFILPRYMRRMIVACFVSLAILNKVLIYTVI